MHGPTVLQCAQRHPLAAWAAGISTNGCWQSYVNVSAIPEKFNNKFPYKYSIGEANEVGGGEAKKAEATACK